MEMISWQLILMTTYFTQIPCKKSYFFIGQEDDPFQAAEANSEKANHSKKLFHEFMKSNEETDAKIAKEEVSQIRNGKVYTKTFLYVPSI